ncbi:MAG: type II toxin-antitoxin system HicA family toxin [Spirochaetaceae bacterium]|nr:MAG: type II toxin-antitoxin system HicA family toxin [Spirochaetaceae bacterium]
MKPLDNDTIQWYHTAVNSKQRKTLEAVFTDPVKAGILWVDIESLLLSSGALMKEGAGSRVGFSLNGVDLIVDRPHPRKEADKGAVKSVRKFLTNAGVRP